eukprot:3504692-Rhodomonas_salina.2
MGLRVSLNTHHHHSVPPQSAPFLKHHPSSLQLAPTRTTNRTKELPSPCFCVSKGPCRCRRADSAMLHINPVSLKRVKRTCLAVLVLGALFYRPATAQTCVPSANYTLKVP